MNIPDEVEAALDGDEVAQLRMMVVMLATHMSSLLIWPCIPADVRTSALTLATAAMDYVQSPRPEPGPPSDDGRDYGHPQDELNERRGR